MKKTLILFTLFTLLSCGTRTFVEPTSGAESLKREDYIIKEEVSYTVVKNRIWILWIPLGGSTEGKRRSKCYAKLIEETKCDGIIAGKYVTKKFTIPLIAVGYTHFQTTLTGRPFYIKKDN